MNLPVRPRVKTPIVIENQNCYFFADETSNDVMNFKDSFLSLSKSSEHSFRPVILKGRYTARFHERIY